MFESSKTWVDRVLLFLDALASLGSMLESQSLGDVFEIPQILGTSSEYVQRMFRVCSEYV